MLFRKHIVSMQTLLQLAVSSVFFVGGAGAAFAANSGVAPVIIPYTVQFLAGNEQPKAGTTPINTTLPGAGYGGDGSTGINTTLSGVSALAVDAAGNVFFADSSNDVIRELNAQTGIVNTIAGVKPSVCSGYQNTSCSKLAVGCADGQPALNSPISGNIHAIAVDEYDNVYFGDSTGFTISVVYHGGKRVSDFISLVNPAGVAKAGGVIPGYVYHIAGTINLSTCVGTKITGSSVASQVDNVLAFQQGELNNTSASQIGLDGAGNIYIQDIGDVVMRVINTQETAQQFFQYVVQPGFIRAIANCSGTFTVSCPGVVTGTSGTGITLPPFIPQNPSAQVDGPNNAVTFNTLSGAGTDAYGNLYEVNNKGATPNIYVGVAYAGGAPLAHLLGVLWKGVNIAYGDWYEGVNDVSANTTLPHFYTNILANTFGGTGGPIIRPTGATADPLGNIWSMDNHWPTIFREDVNSGIMLDVIGYGAGNGAGYPNSTSATPFDNNPPGESITLQYGSIANPIYCVYGYNSTPFASAANPNSLLSPTSNDARGDGCPAILGSISGNGDLISDGFGDIYYADSSNNEVRWFPLFNAFPPTKVGTKVTQPIDIHFDASNQPTVVGGVTSAFTFSAGNTDFALDTTDPEFAALLQPHSSYATYGATTQVGATPASNFLTMVVGPPTCIQNAGSAGDASWDCLVYVTFDPTAVGLRNSQLIATTANGSVYYFPLTGLGTGSQLSIDGGTQATVPATGLGTAPAVAVASTGSIYIADPANNRIVVCAPGSGSLCHTQTAITGASLVWPSTTTTTTLSGPMGVAVDDALNLYISDTGNNRILEVTPVTNAVTILGGSEWVSCAPTAAPTLPTPIVGKPCSVIPAGTAPPVNPNIVPANPAVTPGPIPVSNPLQQYLFKNPQGIAVDLNQNVFVADTGNAAVVMIPKNPVLGGAAALFQYAGGPQFVAPVGVAVDSQNNIYVADEGNAFQQVVKIPPGGGDLQTLLPLGSSLPLIGGQALSTPSGVAVDGAGNVFISDAASNAVWEAPAAGSPFQPFQLTNLIGLNAPLGLALDSGGNLYVANSAADQILYVNRQNPTVNFGNVPEVVGATGVPGNPTGCLANGSSTPCTGVMTVTNSGTQSITLPATPATLTSGPSTFAVTSTCGETLIPGATCTISPTYTPTSTGSQSGTVTLSITGQTIGLVANGGAPEAKIVLTAAYSGGTPTSGGTATYTATVTQPHTPPGGTPTGTVTFTILVDNGLYAAGACGTVPSQTVTLAAGVASTTGITLAQGHIYTITALYNGDANDSPIVSTPLTTTVPGIPVTVSVTSPAPYAYGTKPPTIAGTITGVDSSVTATFTSGASQYSNVEFSPYPITVAFTGGDFCNYGNPATGASVTETPVALTDSVPPITAVYGAPNINFALDLTFIGAVNGDASKLTPIFYTTNPLIPVASSTLNVGVYSINVQFSGKPITPDLDYTPTYVPLSLTIVQAPSTVGGTLSATSELPTAVASATDAISVGTAVSGGIGTPTGTVTVYDTIIPISTGGSGLGATVGTTPLAVELPCTFAFTGTTVTGSSTVFVSSTYDLFVGEAVTGAGIPGGTTITAVSSVGSVFFVGKVTSGSPVITGVASTAGLFPGVPISGPGIPSGATIASIGSTTVTLTVNATATAASETLSTSTTPAITLSANPTATALIVQLIATTSTTPCTTPVTVGPLVNGQINFIPSNTAPFTTPGLHQFTYAYSGDSNFLPSTSAPTAITPATPACAPTVLLGSCLLVDNKDFFIAAPNLSILEIVPGIAPSGNGLLSAPNQGGSSDQQSFPINIVSVVGQTGTATISCLPIGNPYATNFTASTTSGSPVLSSPIPAGTGTVSTAGFTVGDPIAGPGIPSGATVIAVTGTTVTISSNATATATNATLSFVIPPPNGIGTSAVLTASTTFGSPVLTAVSSTTNLSAGEPISGAGIPQGATIVAVGATTITMSLNANATGAGVSVFSVIINVTSLSSSYITCSMTPPTLTLTSNATSQTVVAISIPLTEPVGYKYFTELRMPGSETVLAFLPLGVLAFCVRRRRRLSKALWMLLAIAAVTVGMSGCGARNQVDFFSPFPAGPQYVQITATGASATAPNAPLSRTFLIEIFIE